MAITASRFHRNQLQLISALLLLLCAGSWQAAAQQPVETLRSSAVSQLRYLSAKGQRALIGGTAADGLEMWAYPVLIARNYRVSFRPTGSASWLDGRDLLSSFETAPNRTTRVYVGPGFRIRETLLVPVDRPAAVLTYEVSASTPIDIEVRALPVLDLMWPAGMGGQEVKWSNALHGYLLSEPAFGFQAAIASPQITAHDPAENDRRAPAGGEIAFTLTPDQNHRAQLFITRNTSRGEPAAKALQALEHDADQLQAASLAYWQYVRQSQLQLTTPDERVNRAFAWAETALEQAWVCNEDLGCAFVGGYGPSHRTRRPQYDWFFAGDGMISASAALDAGDWEHARQELEFILRYRDQKTGMIWHELSQSAGLIDWKGKYPYMFVHVDITFQFLSASASYIQATGDLDFLHQHWPELQAAYRYCNSVIDPTSHLPRIPDDKEGANEQDHLADDLGLSTAWVQAAASFAWMAEQQGSAELATEAHTVEQAARSAIPNLYWDKEKKFWINGHTSTGKAIVQLRSSPEDALDLLGPDHSEVLLNTLASSDFQTPWGTRSLSANSPEYDPESYATGSVWPVATAGLAVAFWQHHHPLQAYEIWRSLIEVADLDAPGHLHEVLSGAAFAPQQESVPEQTWSSSGMVSSTVHGLLGLNPDPLNHRLTFAPRFPGDWGELRLEHLRLGKGQLSLHWRKSENQIFLTVQNDGPALQLVYLPQLPLGASLGQVLLNGHKVAADLDAHPQETRARIDLALPHGLSELVTQFAGGVTVLLPSLRLLPGDSNTGLQGISTRFEDRKGKGSSLVMDIDLSCQQEARIRLVTPWKLSAPAGTQLKAITPGEMEALLPAPRCPAGSFEHTHLEFGVER